MAKKNKKKKLMKRVNPERSNKMIIAVAVGIVIVVGTIFFIFTGGEAPANVEEAMEVTMKYLEDSDYLIEVKRLPEQNKVILVYDANADPAKVDFQKVARYAAIKLSNKVKDQEVSIALVSNKDETAKEVFTVIARDGGVLRILQ